MENVEKVAFIVRAADDVWECTRSGLGLGVENLYAGIFIIDTVIEMGDREDDYLENLEMIDDLEGEVYSNVQANVDKYEFIQFMSVEDMGGKIMEYDLMASF